MLLNLLKSTIELVRRDLSRLSWWWDLHPYMHGA
jgi:hypothetical protein